LSQSISDGLLGLSVLPDCLVTFGPFVTTCSFCVAALDGCVGAFVGCVVWAGLSIERKNKLK
jgi:hypothetical protein